MRDAKVYSTLCGTLPREVSLWMAMARNRVRGGEGVVSQEAVLGTAEDGLVRGGCLGVLGKDSCGSEVYLIVAVAKNSEAPELELFRKVEVCWLVNSSARNKALGMQAGYKAYEFDNELSISKEEIAKWKEA